MKIEAGLLFTIFLSLALVSLSVLGNCLGIISIPFIAEKPYELLLAGYGVLFLGILLKGR